MKENSLQPEKILGGKKDRTREHLARPIFGRILRKNGIYDHRLFCAPDRCTYTFIWQQEVVTIHFDFARTTIYYQGHNVDGMALKASHKAHLHKFLTVLHHSEEASDFVKPCAEIIARL